MGFDHDWSNGVKHDRQCHIIDHAQRTVEHISGPIWLGTPCFTFMLRVF
jgi:hypothetical protein